MMGARFCITGVVWLAFVAFSLQVDGDDEADATKERSDSKSPFGEESPAGRYAQFSRFATPNGHFDTFGSDNLRRIKLSMMAFDDDVRIGFGCRVSEDNFIGYFSVSEFSVKGGGYPQISKAEGEILDALLTKLPAEPPLPPEHRRLILCLPLDEGWQARIYDRAELPNELIELSRLTPGIIPSYVLCLDPEHDSEVHPHKPGGLALSPEGKTLVTGSSYSPLRIMDRSSSQVTFNDATKQTAINEICFTPDGAHLLVANHNTILVLDANDWKLIAKLDTSWRAPDATPLQFTRRGEYLIVATRDGVVSYRTATWTKSLLLAIPHDAMAFVPSKSGNHAIMHRRGKPIELWNGTNANAWIPLDIGGRLTDAAFSPDGSKVAVTSSQIESPSGTTTHSLRVFHVPDGRLLHNLRPFESMSFETVNGLLWMPDGEYLMAGAKVDTFFTSRELSVWNIATGRHRANFSGCPHRLTAFVLTPDGKKLIAGCEDGHLREWDFAAGLQQIKSFEATLPAIAVKSVP